MATDYAKLFDGIYWHQRWEIAPGVFTPGRNDVASLMQWGNVPADLRGKRVLDIGAWNGCFSFECERRGASEILAIGPEPAESTGLNKLKAHLGSKVQYQLGTIYDLQPEKIGKFDIIVCFGVIYHLRHPLLGFDMMRRVATGDIFIESAALAPEVGAVAAMVGEANRSFETPALLQFYRLNELNADPSNWFTFNKPALEQLLLSSGFRPIHVGLYHDRIAAHARVIPGPPEWMTIGSGEGFYYDTITKPVLGRPDVY